MVTVVGVIAGAAVLRWDGWVLRAASAQGLARSVSLTMQLARRQAITEGTPAAVVVNRESGVVTGFTLVRAASGGDEPTDAEIEVPSGVTVTAPSDRWEFDYSGALTTPAGGGTLGISDGEWNYDLTVNAVTGHLGVAKTK